MSYHMKVWILNAAIFFIRDMNSEVHHHTPTHKMLQQKLPCKGGVLIQGELFLQGNIKAVFKWNFLILMQLYHSFIFTLKRCCGATVFKFKSLHLRFLSPVFTDSFCGLLLPGRICTAFRAIYLPSLVQMLIEHIIQCYFLSTRI